MYGSVYNNPGLAFFVLILFICLFVILPIYIAYRIIRRAVRLGTIQAIEELNKKYGMLSSPERVQSWQNGEWKDQV